MKTLRYSPTMVDVSIVNETSPEANWNRQTGRQTGRRIGKPMCRDAAPPKMGMFVKNRALYVMI